jgi:MoxR-like ATPase
MRSRDSEQAAEAVARVSAARDQLLAELELAVVGKGDALETVLMGVLADGHVLIEDVPGVAKTLIARSVAAVLSLRFARIQFTPDLLPGDLTGSAVYDQSSGEFGFRPGPIFTNVLLADEINRSPPKTQAALLEAMEERQVTTDDGTRTLDPPFLVMATQNPIEYEGTYPLPEAQLDRFLLRMSVGYPSPADEWEVIDRRARRRADAIELRPQLDGPQVRALQGAVERVHVEPSVGHYMVSLVTATREHPRVQVGASPRGSLALLKLSRARAALGGRPFVTPDDVKAIAVPALAHRLVLAPDLWLEGSRPEAIVEECLASVPVPPVSEHEA